MTPQGEKMKKNQDGFSIGTFVLMLLVAASIGFVGWYVLRSKNKTTEPQSPSSSQNTGSNQEQDPYTDWKTGSSARAGFSFKYPKEWEYSNTVGDKDGVEHIELKTNKFILRMDSFTGIELPGGGTRDSKCDDCKNVISSDHANINRLGRIKLEVVQYVLDAGMGNAIVVRQDDDTYLVPSPIMANQYTTFRGISKLDGLQEYQNESVQQFDQNADLKTAKLILQSISY